MPRAIPTPTQNLASSVLLPLLSLLLLPVSLTAVLACVVNDKLRRLTGIRRDRVGQSVGVKEKGCVMISGGRMTKGLT
jgi:hypothetical protein